MSTFKYKNDGPTRKRLWVAEAMSHPAKGHIAMWEEDGLLIAESTPSQVGMKREREGT